MKSYGSLYLRISQLMYRHFLQLNDDVNNFNNTCTYGAENLMMDLEQVLHHKIPKGDPCFQMSGLDTH